METNFLTLRYLRNDFEKELGEEINTEVGTASYAN